MNNVIEVSGERIGKEDFLPMKESDIVNLNLTDDGLRVLVSTWSSSNSQIGIEYHFNEYRGFRYLDESDLFAYWGESIKFMGNCHLYKIIKGGWISGEVKEKGILDLSLTIKDLMEYFIATSNGCLTVLACSKPTSRKVELF